MEGVNKLILIGSVGGDPEFKELQDGRKLVKFSMATNRTYKKNDTKVTDTQWHNIEAWGDLAVNMAKLIKKGQNLYLEGEVRYGQYEAKDGTKRNTVSVWTKSFNLLPGKPKEDASGNNEAAAAKSVQEFKESSSEPVAETVAASAADVRGDDDDLPF